MGACVFVQRNLALDARVGDLMASYYGEAAFSAVAADLLKPCGEDWLASQVLEGEGEGEASRIQWEAVESMLEQYEPSQRANQFGAKGPFRTKMERKLRMLAPVKDEQLP
eukprot:jgi/Tetstr1/447111/TSEL_034549.t1